MSQILTSGGFWGSVIYCRPDISFLQISIRIGVGGVGVGVFPPVALASGKKIHLQCRRHKRHRFDPWIGKIPWRRKWQPTPVFLKSLVGYSPWGHKETQLKQLSTHACNGIGIQT